MSDLLPEEFVGREVVEEVQDDELGFLDALEEDVPAGFENLVKLRTSSGSSTHIPIEGPVTIHTFLDIAQLKVAMGTAFWVGVVATDPETF
jgi:hypothetical protein